MRRLWLVMVLMAVLPAAALAEIKFSGLFRNDAVVQKTTNEAVFSDIVQQKLVMTRETDDWRFYADARVYAFFGGAARQTITVNGLVVTNAAVPFALNLPRAFIRYNSPIGSWTLGKTYIPLGVMGIFNPFELNRSLDFTDLSAEKDGLLALLYDFSFNDLWGGRLYVAPQLGLTNSGAGGSVFGSVGSFDVGAVYVRSSVNTNKAGLYAKGDVELGVNASYALHWDDYYTNVFQEAALGADYSVLDGKVLMAASFYYDERGAVETNQYNYASTEDKYFVARFYLYTSLAWSPDEFLTLKADTFWNAVDWSGLVIPSVRYALSDGLSVTALGFAVIGDGAREYTPSRMGEWAAVMRVEAKL